MIVQTRGPLIIPFWSTRPLAIGDSITKDTTSVGAHGYRGDVSTLLPLLTWIGSVTSGGSACEAWPGERIEQVSDRLLTYFTEPKEAGITITMLGTNNAAQGQDGPTAVAHYAAYLDRLVGMNPYGRNIVLSTPNTDGGIGVGQATIDAINAALPGQCAARSRCTYLDVSTTISATPGAYADSYHLTNAAYAAIAPLIADAIEALT